STPSATSQRISATASSPTSSPSATPGLGARLGRRDLPTQSHHSSSTFSRFVGSSTDPAAKGNGHRHGPTHALSEDELAHLRPKPHPHTTPSGPRGIEKAQKQRVLQAIRPDPRNLPEELLKANAHLYPSPLIIGEGEDRTPSTSGSASGSGVGQGTEGGAGSTTNGPPGDGLGLGIGLGGKAHPNLSRWVHRQPKNALGAGQMSRRQRRLPSTGREVDARVIHSSVFTPVLTSIMDGQPVTQAPALTPDHTDPMTSERYVALVESVKDAIRNDIQPLRIAQGSSGSYFCRNMQGKIVGVFKPKNEEPYGQLNPKWAKWIHRNLFPCCFGRSCLIPNLGYISEAATSLVDKRLQLNIVPSTEVVWLSSPAFHYDYLDRRAYRNHGKALPDKVGSFQLFLNGFKDANLFMRDHPWPNESHSSLSSYGATGTTARRRTSDSSSSTSTGEQDEGSSENGNRGLDNWMIRYCEKEGISVVAGPPSSGQRPIPQSQQRLQSDSRRNSRIGDLLGLNSDRQSLRSTTSSLRESVPRGGMLATPPGTPPRSSLARPATLPSASGTDHSLEDEANETTRLNPGQRPRVPSPTQPHTSESERIAHATGAARSEDEGTIPLTETEAHFGANHVHVAAIDNGLAFPFKHPDSWRSYPYGWLFLPRALISQPFTKATRDHFLPLLSSPIWWRETIADLRRLFSIDSDFDQGMFDKQMAVMKGQGWNIVETLKNPEQGPMDLCRRVALVIWDEEHILESSAVAKAILTARQPRMPINTPALHVGDGHIQDGASVPAGSLKTIAGMHPFVSAYANTPPKAKMMDASTAAMNYGMSPMTSSSVGVGKTVSASSTAVGDIAHLGRDSGIAMSNSLAYDLAQSLRSGSLKSGSLVPSSSLTKIPPSILVTGGSDGHELDSTLSKGAPLRQVVSDGEYDLDDDYDPDDYSSDEDYDEDPYEEDEDDVFFVQSADEDDATVQHRRSVSLPSAATAAAATRAKKGFVLSIDKALSEMDHAEGNAAEETLGTRRRRRSAEWSRGERHRRRQSHQSEGGRGEEGPSNGQTAAAAKGHHGHGPDGASSHRRSRTEQDDKIGSIRFESNSTGRGGGGGRS
ncbi:phosphatidyl inositol kinase, partial [Lunasporangiospora selenospora]